MKTYKYTDATNQVVHVIDEDGISRSSMLASALPDGTDIIPADPPPPPDPKLVGVLFEGVMCSATRDDQSGLVAVLTAYQLQGAAFQPTCFEFANGNSLVLTKSNIQAFIAVWMPFRQSFFTPS